ncbi:MAG: PAS domain S-box protein, partial [Gemmatimonadaceae bacterium]
VQSSEDAIVTKSLAGIITSWNAGAERLFGYSAGEAIGRPVTLIIPADRIDEEKEILTRLTRGESIAHFETLRVAKDGTVVEVSLSVSPVRDGSGRVVGASKVARDIGERKRTELILRESEERFRMIADNIGVLAWTADRHGRATWYNKRWFDYTGTTSERMAREWEQLYHPDHLARVQQSRTRSLTSGTEWEETFPLRGADGEYRWFLSRAIPIRNSEGEVTLWFGTNVDVNERIEMEAALRDADRRKDEFVATLAHELRNPLAPLQHSLHVLDTEDAPPETMTGLVAVMQRQVTQMTRLVEDLIDISRINTGKFELRRENVTLESLVHQALETVRPLFAASRHNLTVALPSMPVYLNADSVRLSQALTNLLRNACKFTDPGGHISLTAVTDATHVVIAVVDDGIGIPADRLKSVFEMFAQGHEALEESRGGLGIGLTLVKRVVELHGGVVTATSAGRGRGSAFVVRLPMVHEIKATVTDPGAPTTLQRTKHRFLIADDNVDSADTLAMLLRLQGGDVVTVYDGDAAVEAFARDPADIVLLDIGMPKRSGHETCRTIRQAPGGRDALIIALTGWGQKQDRERSNEAGFDAHFVKPINQDALSQLLREYEKKRR